MNRRELFKRAGAFGILTAMPSAFVNQLRAASATGDGKNPSTRNQSMPIKNPLHPPAHDPIPVAFLVSDGAVMIDFAGPWEVFQDVMIPNRGASMDEQMPFRLYTVAQTRRPIEASGGMKIIPDYTFDNAPAPKVLVIPAQSAPTPRTKAWIRKVTKNTDVTMSVCTGAFVLASTGLLSGKSATTIHGSYARLATTYPDIQVKRGLRFVEDGNLASSGGLSSGIDLALRVVERYFGTEVAEQTAFSMEYQGEGWKNPNSNAMYAQPFAQNARHPVCPVCGMDPDLSLQSEYKGKTYYFCSQDHKQEFQAAPEKFIVQTGK
jgi:putative intracellular protease/amidase/YHS domain-containing protein